MILFKDINFSHILYTGIITIFTVVSLTGCDINGQSQKTGDIDLMQTNIYNPIYAELFNEFSDSSEQVNSPFLTENHTQKTHYYNEDLVQDISRTVVSITGLANQSKILTYLDDDGVENFLNVDTLNYVSYLGFDYLFNIFDDIEFIVDFSEIDEEINELFLENFYKMLMGESLIYVGKNMLRYGESSQELYICDIIIIFRYSHPAETLFKYYFLDFSGDGYPELGVIGNTRYFFRYIPSEDRFLLWYITNANWYFFIAPNRMSQGGGNVPINNHFVIIDENAITEMIIHFNTEFLNNKDDDTTGFNLVSLPLFSSESNELYIPAYLEKQGITFGDNSLMYFRVTDEQFSILRQDFNYLRINRRNRIERKSFHELFGIRIENAP